MDSWNWFDGVQNPQSFPICLNKMLYGNWLMLYLSCVSSVWLWFQTPVQTAGEKHADNLKGHKRKEKPDINSFPNNIINAHTVMAKKKKYIYCVCRHLHGSVLSDLLAKCLSATHWIKASPHCLTFWIRKSVVFGHILSRTFWQAKCYKLKSQDIWTTNYPIHPTPSLQFPFDTEHVCEYTQQGMKASLMCLWFTVAASCRCSQNDTWDTSGMIVWAQNLNMLFVNKTNQLILSLQCTLAFFRFFKTVRHPTMFLLKCIRVPFAHVAKGIMQTCNAHKT